MIRLPQDKKWVQTNRSDNFGNIWSSFNIDLNQNLGVFSATKMLVSTTTAGNADLSTVPCAFKYFPAASATIWTTGGTKMLKNDGTINGTFTTDATASTPTDIGSDVADMEIFNGRLYVANGLAKLYRLTSAPAWSTPIASGLGNGHRLCAFGARLYIAQRQSSIIGSIDTGETLVNSGTAAYSLDLSGQGTFFINWIRAASNKIWIGTSSRRNGKGMIFEWDGVSNQATRLYRLESQGALSCVIKDDIPYVMDSNGKLLVFSSGSFKEIARLPLRQKYLIGATQSDTLNATGFIHYNGMSLVDGRINLFINNQVDDSAASIVENCPSGIWEYSDDNGLYHKYSLSYTPTNSTTITDWGQNRIAQAGPIGDLKVLDNSSDANGAFLVGARYYTDATTGTYGIFFNDTVEALSGSTQATQKVAYIVTTKQNSQQVTDIWQYLYASYQRFLSATDKIVAKYRLYDIDPTEITLTWTSTTTFTTTADISAYAVGDEVEVLSGKGSGLCSHITTISLNAGTYTVTVDETYTGATSGTAKARLQKWIKLGYVADQTSQFKKFGFPVSANSTWVQLKIMVIFTSPNMELEELILQTINSQLAVSK